MVSNQSDIYQILNTFKNLRTEKNLLNQFSEFWKVTLWFTMLSSLAIGRITKYLMFKQIARIGFKDQPINWMIVTEQFINLVCSTFILSSFLISHTMDMTIGDIIIMYFHEYITDRQYCWIFCNCQLLTLVYKGVNGAGMAFVRILYLLKGDWVKNKLGLRRFFISSWISVLTMSAAVMSIYFMESITQRPLYFVCLGRDELFEVKLKLPRLCPHFHAQG
jgi:hypothetical protein